MTYRIEFGSKAAADRAREEHDQHLCSEDDRRLKTVAFASSLPDTTLDQLEAGAQTGRIEGESGPGQAELTSSEKSRVGPFEGSNNYRKATAVKALLTANGVSDWTVYYDPTLSVDEHRSSVLPTARQEGGGSRSSSEEAKQQRKQQARQAERAVGGQCNHARDHCSHDDTEACEFLRETCGYEQSTIDDILADLQESDEPELSGQQRGALSRSWNGYKGAISEVEQHVDALREEWEQAQQAARAINAIRSTVDQDPIHFDRLEELQAEVLDLVRAMAADCHECHADHSSHDHSVTDGDRETVHEFVEAGGASTAVGTGDHPRPEAKAYPPLDDDGEPVIEQDEQRDLAGDHVDQQSRLAGGESGEVESEVEQPVDQNPGGIMADERDTEESVDAERTEQQTPDEFTVPEGGQDTI